MHKKILLLMLTAFFLIQSGCASALFIKPQNEFYESLSAKEKLAYRKTLKWLRRSQQGKRAELIPMNTGIDSLRINREKDELNIYFSKRFSYRVYREKNIAAIYRDVNNSLGWRFRGLKLNLFSEFYEIGELVPNIYRQQNDLDMDRMKTVENAGEISHIRNISKPNVLEQGLQNRHIAMWHSHGWYYNNGLDRWEWERPRLWQTVEDLYPLSYTIPFLYPMLENAGAVVMLPRERDPQVNESVVDNDLMEDSELFEMKNITVINDSLTGFSPYPKILDDENPFLLGTALQFASDSSGEGSVTWVADIPEKGKYAVYFSYVRDDEQIRDAHYSVYHKGGKTEFLVDQSIGGPTWHYFGTFQFDPEDEPRQRCVVLSTKSSTPGALVSADAVRFGGGMGNIRRNGHSSRRARFYEASRYYLQYAGLPDTMVYDFHEDTLDYNDDYKSRGEWVNYLMGAPNGPTKDPAMPGLNIPVDLSLAFHTDAGITDDESVIGTLVIYSGLGIDTLPSYPDGRPRIASRDYADIMQTQIVNDLRAKWDPDWSRRAIYNSLYSEAFRPHAPGMILELLSHQNFQDMKFGLNPAFRFDVSRAIYKSMLRFISFQDGNPYVVQPLPVDHFAAEFNSEGDVELTWKAVSDPLEATAEAEKFIVYIRPEDGDFDNGHLLDEPRFVHKSTESGKIYSYKVTAVNKGGESFPSEILSVCRLDSAKHTALIVNSFDRISAPHWQDHGAFSGFLDFLDEGVPYKLDHSYVGRQYDFIRKSPFRTNDIPGHGSSFSDMETKVLAGNSFDYPLIHGDAMRAAGLSFVSAGDEAAFAQPVDPDQYAVIDIIGGEEKFTPPVHDDSFGRFSLFDSVMTNVLSEYFDNGGKVYLSAAYIASDPMIYSIGRDSSGAVFVRERLKLLLRRTQASLSGELFSRDSMLYPLDAGLRYNDEWDDEYYKLEAPDEIRAADSSAMTLLRFEENHFGCAVYTKTDSTAAFSMSVPFETIPDRKQRHRLMKGIMDMLFDAPSPLELTQEIPVQVKAKPSIEGNY